jgi:hypothetical protein
LFDQIKENAFYKTQVEKFLQQLYVDMTEEETFGIVRYAVFPASDSDWKFVIVFLFFYSDSEADIETRRTMKEKPKISTTI